MGKTRVNASCRGCTPTIFLPKLNRLPDSTDRVDRFPSLCRPIPLQFRFHFLSKRRNVRYVTNSKDRTRTISSCYRNFVSVLSVAHFAVLLESNPISLLDSILLPWRSTQKTIYRLKHHQSTLLIPSHLRGELNTTNCKPFSACTSSMQIIVFPRRSAVVLFTRSTHGVLFCHSNGRSSITKLIRTELTIENQINRDERSVTLSQRCRNQETYDYTERTRGKRSVCLGFEESAGE